MSKTRPFDRRTNLFSGIALLVLIALGGTYAGYKKLKSMPSEPPRVYVAYFENSGGLRDGDRVRIQGRAAGKVNKVEVVNHEGKIVTRVEFEITPGTGSPWLKEMERAGGIPSDSTIGVRMPSFLGRPLLVINIGKDDENPIGEGGEWVNTTSANNSDQLTQWGEDIERGREQIRRFVEFFDDEEQFEKLNKNLGEIANALEQTDKAMTRWQDQPRLDDALTQAQSGMDDARVQLGEMNTQAGERLPELSKQLEDGAGRLDQLAEDLDRAMSQVHELNESLDGNVSGLEKSKLDEMGLELRRLSTRLRAGMALGEQDPKQFGDLPNWRKSRAYFHGGQPWGGTSIDDPPPPAPSERAGVPGGKKE